MKIAQITNELKFELDKTLNMKANRKYVFILDTEEMKFYIENYYLFVFKNWFKKLSLSK